MLYRIPTKEEVQHAVFGMSAYSSPGPGGFNAFFYQTYQDVISLNVFSAINQFLTSNWLVPNLNANIVVLHPKCCEAGRIEQYRTILMANFKFQIITKILAHRLFVIVPNIISP